MLGYWRIPDLNQNRIAQLEQRLQLIYISSPLPLLESLGSILIVAMGRVHVTPEK